MKRFETLYPILQHCAKIAVEWQQKNGSKNVRTKKDRSPVTSVDLYIQHYLSDQLALHYPNIPILAEEEVQEFAGYQLKHAPHFLSKGESLPPSYWVLDPIDGTKGLIRGEHFATALALIQKGEVVEAYLSCPNAEAKGALYYATKGEGAYQTSLENGAQMGRRIYSAKNIPITETVLCESFESHHSSRSASTMLRERLGIFPPSIRLDSQEKYGLVATGKASLYFRLSPSLNYEEKIWDHAPGTLLVEESGGKVTDLRGNPLDFSSGWSLTKNLGIMASNGMHHQVILNVLREHWKGRLS